MTIKKVWPYALVLLPWFLYIAITFLSARTGTVRFYGLDPRQLFYVRLSSIVFNGFNWLAGCFGVITCFSAAREVPEKKGAFTRMGRGLLVLLVGAVLGTTLAALRSLYASDPKTVQTLTVAVQEVFALAPLVGLGFIFSGSGALVGRKEGVDIWTGWKAAGYAALAALASINVWFVFSTPDRVPGHPQLVVPYYATFFVIALTLLLPYLASYAFAFFSAFRGARYFLNNGGAVYKSASGSFIVGLCCLMLWSFFQQVTISVGPTRSAGMGLLGNLAVIYVYLVAQCCGYLFLAFSVRKISGIERLRHRYDAPADRDDAAMPPPAPLPDFRPFGS